MNRGERLTEYVARFAGVPISWGLDDCCAWPAAWVRAETGIALPLPHYASEAEGRALMADGLERCWSDALSREGFWTTGTPEVGDVGLIETTRGAIGVVFAHAGFCVARGETGVGMLRPRRILRAWSIPER